MSNAQQLAKKELVITPFHKSLFAEIEKGRKATGTMIERMSALLKSKYGETMPTWLQAKEDRSALKSLGEEKGLVDDQWLRKPYNAACHAVYGGLPVSTSAAAKKKQAKAGTPVKAGKSGAPKGETAPRRQSEPESIEQYIARIGVYKVLEQCCAILEADESTKEIAQAIRADAKRAA
jgi:hypothetical protein